ncbi:MAG TPA: helix-turn-helix transcriptional regulator [Modicisalibacter sp.]|nr:helix-turn-helix transcriptional regulator [Modicisalibacter sp.]
MKADSVVRSSAAHDYDDLLFALYSAADQPARLKVFLQAVARALKAHNASLITPGISWEDGGVWLTLDPRQSSLYEEHATKFCGNNPWEEAEKRLQEKGQLLADQAWTDADLGVSQEDFERSDFFREYAAPLEIYRFITIALPVDTLGSNFDLCVFRRECDPPFGSAERELIARLGRHIQLLLSYSSQRWHDSIRVWIDLTPHAIWLFDAERKPRIYNRSAANLIAEERVVSYYPGRLSSKFANLASAIAALVNAVDLDDPKTATRRVMTPFGKVSVTVSGLPPAEEGNGASVAYRFRLSVTLMPECRGDPHPYTMYGLSPAEGRLAALLVSGLSLREAASEAGVAYSTVRSQLNSLFQKVGVRRQVDLVNRLQNVGMPSEGMSKKSS